MKLIMENWRKHVLEQSYMKDTGVQYTALVLDDPAALVSNLKEQGVEIPKEWLGLDLPPEEKLPHHKENEDLPHHMTILSPKDQKIRYPSEFLNQPHKVRVTGWAIDDRVLAVTVETDLPTKQDIPHITIALSATGKKSDSNDLLASGELTKLNPFTVGGVIKEIT
jgi:hypothetical protein